MHRNQIERREKVVWEEGAPSLLPSLASPPHCHPPLLTVGPILGILLVGVRHHTSTSPSLFDWIVKVIWLEFIPLSCIVWRACEVEGLHFQALWRLILDFWRFDLLFYYYLGKDLILIHIDLYKIFRCNLGYPKKNSFPSLQLVSDQTFDTYMYN